MRVMCEHDSRDPNLLHQWLPQRLRGWLRRWLPQRLRCWLHGWLNLLLGMGVPQQSGEDWDRMYHSGQWHYMRDVHQLGRYAIIAGYLRHYTQGPRILDVGCGEGLLLQHLWPEVQYTGIDISEVALQKLRDDPRSKTICTSMEAYFPGSDDCYDAIVFNELLYYIPDPLGELERYRRCLAPNGILIVSMVQPRKTNSGFYVRKSIWRGLVKRGWIVLDEVIVTHPATCKTGRIQVLKWGDNTGPQFARTNMAYNKGIT